jgi:hypothetical protein
VQTAPKHYLFRNLPITVARVCATSVQTFFFVDGGVTPYNKHAFMLFWMATLPQYRLRSARRFAISVTFAMMHQFLRFDSDWENDSRSSMPRNGGLTDNLVAGGRRGGAEHNALLPDF